jgi:hypothetical protein
MRAWTTKFQQVSTTQFRPTATQVAGVHVPEGSPSATGKQMYLLKPDFTVLFLQIGGTTLGPRLGGRAREFCHCELRKKKRRQDCRDRAIDEKASKKSIVDVKGFVQN